MLRRAFFATLFVLFSLTHAWAVCGVSTGNCFWVGGTGNWDGTATRWASTSGGAGGVAAPISTSPVFFDANSGGGTATISAGNTGAASVDTTGYTGTIAGSAAITISGSVTLGASATHSYNGTMTINGTSTFTSNGKTYSGDITVSGVTVTLGDALTGISTTSLTLTAANGTFNANNKAVTIGDLTASGTNTGRTLTMGSGTWTIIGGGTVWTLGASGLTFNKDAAAIVLTSASAQVFDSGGYGYNGISWTSAGSGNRTLNGGGVLSGNLIVSAGSGNFTVASGLSVVGNLDFTGFTGSWSASSGTMTLTDNLTLGSGMTVAVDTDALTLDTNGAGNTRTITTNGVLMQKHITINNAGNTYVLGDAFNSGTATGYIFQVSGGTFNTNNFNMTIGRFESDGTTARTVTLGSSTIELNGTGAVWDTDVSTNLTFNANTSTIKITESSASTKSFRGGNLTYNNIWSAQGSTGILQILQGNTFNNFKVTNEPRTITFENGVTQTIATLTAAGTPGNLITFNSLSPGSAFTLSDTTGTNTCDYCSITDSTASGGATWCATNSTDGGGNTGWNFACAGGATPSRLMLIGVGGMLDERYRPANDNNVSLRNAA